PTAPTNGSVTPVGTPSGYGVEYMVTKVNWDEEGHGLFLSGSYQLPISVSEANDINVRVQTGSTRIGDLREIRVYRRPTSGGAFGFIGSSNDFFSNAGNLEANFRDIGLAADFSHQPPDRVETLVSVAGGFMFNPQVGVMYQQRLILA